MPLGGSKTLQSHKWWHAATAFLLNNNSPDVLLEWDEDQITKARGFLKSWRVEAIVFIVTPWNCRQFASFYFSLSPSLLWYKSHQKAVDFNSSGAFFFFFVPQPSQLDLRRLWWEGRDHSPCISPWALWQQIKLSLNSEVLGTAHWPKGNAVMKTLCWN